MVLCRHAVCKVLVKALLTLSRICRVPCRAVWLVKLDSVTPFVRVRRESLLQSLLLLAYSHEPGLLLLLLLQLLLCLLLLLGSCERAEDVLSMLLILRLLLEAIQRALVALLRSRLRRLVGGAERWEVARVEFASGLRPADGAGD